MYISKIAFLAAAFLSASPSFAQNTPFSPPTDTIPTQHLQPKEVRALRAGSNAPFAKTDLTAKDIALQNLGQDLPILLQYTPSAVTTSDAGTGVGYTGLRIRGADASRINVTFNGVPVNDPEEQAVFFVDIPDIASSASSIQVQRGVGTSTNGAGAFGGTISISNLRQMDSAGAIYSSSYGSFNTFKNTLQAGTGLLKNGWQFDVRLSKINSDGYIQRSAADLKSLQFTAGWKASDNTSLHFLVMTGTEKTGQAWDGVPQDSLKTNRTYNELGLKSDGSYYNNQTDNYQQDYYQLFLDHNFSKYFSAHAALFMTRGKGFYEEYKAADAYANYGLPNVVSPMGDTTSTTDLIRQKWLDNYYYGSVFSLLYDKHRTHLAFGGGWTQFENLHYGKILWAQNGGIPDHYEWYRNNSQKNDFNIYMKAQQNVSDKVILFGDVQYRNVAYFINGFDDNASLKPAVNYNFFNPKAGITYLVRNTAQQRQKIYLSGAIANREPNHDDFEVDPLNLPKPETLYDAEAGYEINKPKWTAGVNLYYMYYQNQLVLTGQINDVGAYTQTNVPESYRAGIELQGAVTIAKWLKLSANATFSQNKITHFTEYIDDYDNGGQQTVAHSNTNIAFSPTAIAGGDITLTPFTGVRFFRHLSIDILGKYVGKQYLDNSGDNDRAIDAYNFFNVLMHYTFKPKPFKEVTATLALNNVFNQLYQSNGYTYSYYEGGTLNTGNYYFPQAGFNVMCGIGLKL